MYQRCPDQPFSDMHCYSWIFILYYFRQLQIHMYQGMPNVSHIETCTGALVLLNLYSILLFMPWDWWVPRNPQCQSYWNMFRSIGIHEPLFYTILHTYWFTCTKDCPMSVILKHIQVHWYSWTFLPYYFKYLQIHMYQEMPNVSHIETCSSALVLLNLSSVLFYTPTDLYVPRKA